MKKKERRDTEFLQKALHNNGAAIIEGPKKKRWTQHDITDIRPLTSRQEDFFDSFEKGYNIFGNGTTGTGKSFISVYLAFMEILNGCSQKNIRIIRSAAEVREQGHVPGTQDEKDAKFEDPYRNILAHLVGRTSTYDDMKNAGLINFHTTGNLRSLTWDNSIIIADEVQNMNFEEINTVVTRAGINSRVILLGDFLQNDLIKRSNDKSGFQLMLKVIEKIPSFHTITFTQEDIVRSELVREWIIACEEVRNSD